MVRGFYAEVERAADPRLRERPVIVGGDPRKHGTVQSASDDALAAGVVAEMPMREALERCPHARVLRTNMKAYREVAGRLRAIFRQETDRVEPAERGAAYLEASGDEPVDVIARRLQERVAGTLGLPLRVGAGPVRFVARLAAEEAGSDGVLCVRPNEVRRFLDPLPVAKLPGAGRRTTESLAELGASTVADVLKLGRDKLEERLGNHGRAIHALAQGIDRATVRAAPHPRTVSHEITLPIPEVDRTALEARLAELASHVEATLARERLAAKRLVLKVRYADREQQTRTRTERHSVARAPELLALAADLLTRTDAGSRPIRGLGLAATTLVQQRRDDRQLDLFTPPR